jgi:hypothetical protein
MFPPVAVGQSVVRGASERIGAQGINEIRRFHHHTGFDIQGHLDLDIFAGRNTGSLSVGVAQADQVAAAHDGNSAPPGVPVDRDSHWRTFASAERLDHSFGYV